MSDIVVALLEIESFVDNMWAIPLLKTLRNYSDVFMTALRHVI